MNFDSEGHDRSNNITSFLHHEFSKPMNLVNYLKGKKTYLLAAALLGYALGGYLTGHLNGKEALDLIWSSGVVSSLRAAITNG